VWGGTLLFIKCQNHTGPSREQHPVEAAGAVHFRRLQRFFISLGHFLQWQHALDLKIEHLIRGEYVVVVLFHLFDLPNNTKKPRLSIGKVDVV
jgi:hypothetical protein